MTAEATAPTISRLRLRLEVVALYVAIPMALAILVEARLLSTSNLSLVFIALFAVALGVLAFTPGFKWRTLWRESQAVRRHWRFALMYMVCTVVLVYGLTVWMAPSRLWYLPTNLPETWITVLIFYPIVSVFPQGIMYRALFFARYAPAFPSLSWAIAANAVFFGLGHLFYLNWVAVVLTMIGGALFAWAHAKRGSFLLALVLHAIAGWSLFTIGLGSAYFYTGNIDV